MSHVVIGVPWSILCNHVRAPSLAVVAGPATTWLGAQHRPARFRLAPAAHTELCQVSACGYVIRLASSRRHVFEKAYDRLDPLVKNGSHNPRWLLVHLAGHITSPQKLLHIANQDLQGANVGGM